MTRNELKQLWFSIPHDKNKKQVNTILVETKYGHVTITRDGPSGYSSFKTHQEFPMRYVFNCNEYRSNEYELIIHIPHTTTKI